MPIQSEYQALPGAARWKLQNIEFLSHFISIRGLILRLLEMLVLSTGFLAVNRIGADSAAGDIVMGGVYIAVIMASLQAFAMYQRHRAPLPALLGRLFVVYVVAVVAIAGLSWMLPLPALTRTQLAASISLSFALSLALRLALPAVAQQLLPVARVVVIGSDHLAHEVCAILRATDPLEGVCLHGQYDPKTQRFSGFGTALSREINLGDLVAEDGVAEIVVASAEQRGLPLAELLHFKMNGVQVTDYVSFLEREKRYLAIDEMRPSWLLFSNGFQQGPARIVAKRLFDVLVSLTLLLFLSPFLLLAMLAVFLETGRPIFFRQDRVGAEGRIFGVLKLRSMVTDAERNGVPQWAQKNDSRVTRVGKILRLTRIDEIPQLISVLRGDMSFVGPRPERDYFVRQLREQIPFYDLRHAIKPGLSGWAQVSYPYGASTEDARAKLRYDLYYIKNHSLLLDILILLATVRIVVFGAGAR